MEMQMVLAAAAACWSLFNLSELHEVPSNSEQITLHSLFCQRTVITL